MGFGAILGMGLSLAGGLFGASSARRAAKAAQAERNRIKMMSGERCFLLLLVDFVVS